MHMIEGREEVNKKTGTHVLFHNYFDVIIGEFSEFLSKGSIIGSRIIRDLSKSFLAPTYFLHT